MSDTRFPFVSGREYHFVFKGQGRSIAATSPTEVHVVPTVIDDNRQLWVAEKDVDIGQFRFRNVSTRAFLEKQDHSEILQAKSTTAKTNFQFIEALDSSEGVVLQLIEEERSSPISVKIEGTIYWLALQATSASHFDIKQKDTTY